MRVHLPFAICVLVAASGQIACLKGEVTGGKCPAGKVLTSNGECRTACLDDNACAACEKCNAGACIPNVPCGACDVCTDSQVCVDEQCQPGCGAAGECTDDRRCVRNDEGIRYCAVVSDTRAVGGVPGFPVQESTGGGFKVRGAVTPLVGATEGPSKRVVPVAD